MAVVVIMARRERRQAANSDVALSIRDLQVYYGKSHVLQGVSFEIERGVFAIVGRNGMGKTTLCNAIMGLVPVASGSVRVSGQEIRGLAAHRINGYGVSYTPQGRRLWPSLTVDEHLRMVSSRGAWTRERVYEAFPRLYERQRNNADQLSGGEQQMLSISRALLQDPRLLILDEPTEGLAPVVVTQVEEILTTFASENDVAILLIEQNLAVATTVADEVGIMVNGKIVNRIASTDLAADRALQERLLGVGRHESDESADDAGALPLEPLADASTDHGVVSADTASVDKDDDSDPAVADQSAPIASHSLSGYQPPTRWSNAHWEADAGTATTSDADTSATAQSLAQTQSQLNEPDDPLPFDQIPKPLYSEPGGRSGIGKVAHLTPAVVLVGTFDTKANELNFIKQRLVDESIRVQVVDVSTSGKPSSADVPPHVVAAFHPNGAGAVFSGNRGESVKAMGIALERWADAQSHISGMISAGGSGGTSMVTPAMQRLAVGVPKVMISTVASGEVGQYVGPSDIMMMYSVTDILGLNRISRRVLSNGASAIAGMVDAIAKSDLNPGNSDVADKSGIGMTMFGVTTTAVEQISAKLQERFDCLVFHATGTGGRSMEKLVDSGLLESVIDVTTTEVCDMMMGGVFAATEDRFGAIIRTGIPYVGSVGALDMVNFGSPATVPQAYQQRLFVEHNANVTLMRTTAAENEKMGRWIAGRLNEMAGPVRFLLPENGVSALDAPGQPFHDPAADNALFEAIKQNFRATDNHRLISLPSHINDPAFAQAAVDNFDEIYQNKGVSSYATA